MKVLVTLTLMPNAKLDTVRGAAARQLLAPLPLVAAGEV